MGQAARLPTKESRGKVPGRYPSCPLHGDSGSGSLMAHLAFRLVEECHGARSGQGTRASARRKRFHPLTAPARHDRWMLVGTKGVPTVSTTPPAGRTKGC